MKTGIALIEEERRRQIEEEGWTAGHDDLHIEGELAVAAARYAVSSLDELQAHCGRDPYLVTEGGDGLDAFPWPSKWDKRDKHSPLRRLIIAGALIAAEIDRLLREEEES